MKIKDLSDVFACKSMVKVLNALNTKILYQGKWVNFAKKKCAECDVVSLQLGNNNDGFPELVIYIFWEEQK